MKTWLLQYTLVDDFEEFWPIEYCGSVIKVHYNNSMTTEEKQTAIDKAECNIDLTENKFPPGVDGIRQDWLVFKVYQRDNYLFTFAYDFDYFDEPEAMEMLESYLIKYERGELT